MKDKFFLRLEGVNISNFVYDTQDLNTVRGGGLLLLDSIEMVWEKFKFLEPISTGASSGLFMFEADDINRALSLRDEIEKFLNDETSLSHATFVVDIQPFKTDEDFIEDKELVIAKNRWRQMQSPSVAAPSGVSELGKTACRIDNVRPATELDKDPEGKDVYVSKSVKVRRDYGKKEKKNIYYRNNPKVEKEKWEFVNHLDSLTSDESKGNLHHKMALIYLDGNGFGDIRERLCKNCDDEHKFDTTVKEYRQTMLAGLLDGLRDDPGWINGSEYRIETLLWGGDELMWVVPAWKGWEALEFFYLHSGDWEFKNTNGEKSTLKHAGGLIFCHHNAPIYRIKALAQKLSNEAKADKSRNLFGYQVLESFDHIGKDLKEFRENRSLGLGSQTLILDGRAMSEIKKHFHILKNGEFSKSRLHAIAKGLMTDKRDVEKKKTHALIKKTIGESDMEIKEALNSLSNLCGGDEMRWLHIVDLWDYIP